MMKIVSKRIRKGMNKMVVLNVILKKNKPGMSMINVSKNSIKHVITTEMGSISLAKCTFCIKFLLSIIERVDIDKDVVK